MPRPGGIVPVPFRPYNWVFNNCGKANRAGDMSQWQYPNTRDRYVPWRTNADNMGTAELESGGELGRGLYMLSDANDNPIQASTRFMLYQYLDVLGAAAAGWGDSEVEQPISIGFQTYIKYNDVTPYAGANIKIASMFRPEGNKFFISEHEITKYDYSGSGLNESMFYETHSITIYPDPDLNLHLTQPMLAFVACVGTDYQGLLGWNDALHVYGTADTTGFAAFPAGSYMGIFNPVVVPGVIRFNDDMLASYQRGGAEEDMVLGAVYELHGQAGLTVITGPTLGEQYYCIDHEVANFRAFFPYRQPKPQSFAALAVQVWDGAGNAGKVSIWDGATWTHNITPTLKQAGETGFTVTHTEATSIKTLFTAAVTNFQESIP